MTGIAGLLVRDDGDNRKINVVFFMHRLLKKIYRTLIKEQDPQKFVILCTRRTGSNLLCGILYKHKNIVMHNELFNETSIHTYYQDFLSNSKYDWHYESRDICPDLFMRDMYSSYKHIMSENPSMCLAVGFKSFPHHYLESGQHPNDVLQNVYDHIIEDYDTKKIILSRNDVVAVYISACRSRITGLYLSADYSHIKIKVKLTEMQNFIDLYRTYYKAYKMQTMGQRVCHVTYEDLCDDLTQAVARVLRFLGVPSSPGDISEPLEECKKQASGPTSNAISNYDEVEYAFRHTDVSEYLPRIKPAAEGTASSSAFKFEQEETDKVFVWSLLFPVCSRGLEREECIRMLTTTRDSLIASVEPDERQHIYLCFGIDEGDPVYHFNKGPDNKTLDDIITSLFPENLGFKGVHIEILTQLQGKICKIWNRLANVSFTKLGADFTVLLGDDVQIRSVGWKCRIEALFANISSTTGLPFGAGCVAFHDLAFEGFPTFPVVHKWHQSVFGQCLPFQLVNQGGDPFLFELYKRYNASRFAQDCVLVNLLGGKQETSRYFKRPVRFEDDILTQALKTLSDALGGDDVCQPTPCIDIVVPTFRCHVDVLHKIVNLRASIPAMITFFIVIDNPFSPKIDEVRAMRSVACNYSVQIREHSNNRGASAARNTGLGYSYADWVIFLDDDVTPSECLLDAYIGGTLRFPQARVLVGSTHLPPPINLLTRAIVASDIPGMYTVAEKRRDPPWGVTANLCVKNRTSRIRFQMNYPKTGGGEDIDYCVRMGRHGAIRSVPGALAFHPWWCDGGVSALKHILGWAEGESMCVESKFLKEHVFFSPPNGMEIILLSLIAYVGFTFIYIIGSLTGVSWHGTPLDYLPRICRAFSFIIVMETFYHRSHVLHRVPKELDYTSSNKLKTEIDKVSGNLQEEEDRSELKKKLYKTTTYSKISTALYEELVAVCAAWLVMSQESARLVAHLRRRSFRNICHRFDWYCGKNPNFIIRTIRMNSIRSLIYLSILCFDIFLFLRQLNSGSQVC